METCGLYIHIPFCVRKCQYCDFLSFSAGPDPECLSSYLYALQNEMVSRKSLLDHQCISSIFIGGGTPSLMRPSQITELMHAVYQHFSISKDAEITMECNPGTLTREKLDAMKAAGINRISIGLQSTNAMELKALGRIHDYETFLESYHLARAAGFKNINIDLMSALPGQSIASYEESLDRVLALEPEHISAYSLIIEEGTPFGDAYDEDGHCLKAGFAPLPSEEDERLMYELTKEVLSAKGYERYEISNYAKPGYACRHNQIYWTGGNYLGLGLGASSLYNAVRFSNITELKDYLSLWQKAVTTEEKPLYIEGSASVEHLSREAQMEEFMFLGLRLTRGISIAEFEMKFQVSIYEIYGDVIKKHLQDQTLILQDDRLKLTDLGLNVANYCMSDFILVG